MSASSAWQAVVSGEDAAIYAYGLAGARLPGTARDRAERSLREHRAMRARAVEFVTQEGGTAPVPAVAYSLEDATLDSRQAEALLAQVELALTSLYAQAAGDSSGSMRARAARAATQCASRATTWGAAPEAFPD